MRKLGLSVGITQASPEEIYDAVIVQHMTEIELRRLDAVTKVQTLSLAAEGGDPVERLGHLYPPTEYRQYVDRMHDKREEDEELKRQQALLVTLKRYASVKRIGFDDRRKHK